MEGTCFVKLLCAIAIFHSIVHLAESFPSGAPMSACDTLAPNPFSHGAPPNTDPIPYSIDLSDFDEGDGVLGYQPGTTYQSTLPLILLELL